MERKKTLIWSIWAIILVSMALYNASSIATAISTIIVSYMVGLVVEMSFLIMKWPYKFFAGMTAMIAISLVMLH